MMVTNVNSRRDIWDALAEMPAPEPFERKLAIVGKGATRTLAPYDDPAWDVWVCHDHAWSEPVRVTGVFEVHDDALTSERYQQGYRDWLREEHPFPIYMLTPDPNIPASVQYPLEEVINLYGTDYFTSTIAYMIALGTAYRYDRIKLWGVHMTKPAYVKQRDCIFFWLGAARACGVNVEVCEESGLRLRGRYPREIDNL